MFKDIVNHPDYHNRHEEIQNVEHVAILAGRDWQSAEENEIQCITDDKIRALGYSLYIDGTIIEGCDITLDTGMKVAHLAGGRVFIAGHVREVAAATLSIPADEETVEIGIWKKSKILTEHENNILLNPAVGTPGYLQPGAYRVITTAEWGLNLDNLSMPFYPIYTISGGEIVSQIIREKNQDYLDALARYDRDSHGHYVVEGLRVTALANANPEDDGKKQTYSISQGLAHIHGYEARLTHSVRLVVSEDADLYDVVSEAHQFEDGGEGGDVIPVHQTPIESIKSVRVTKEKTVTLTHGSYTGCSDSLPDTSVIKIVKVDQGGYVYASNTYRLDANKVNWEVEGDEPAPGSTYTVTYHYRTNVTPDSSDYTSLTLSGLVDGSLVEIDYSYRMPRRDIIVMYRDRSVTMVKGIPHRYSPVLPSTPPGAICLATVEQTWTGLPVVKNMAIQAVRMDTLMEMRTAIKDLYQLSAIERLKVDAMLSAPSSAFGVFVDPLLDDDMRDKGTPQTGAVIDQQLILPLDIDIFSLPGSKILTLDYETDVLAEQTMHTKCMQVNPYMVFDPLPAQVKLDPAIDRWTDEIVNSISSGTAGSTTEENAEGTLRTIQVEISAVGFGPEEPIRVFFDGLEVPCSATKADADGCFDGTITVPPDIPTGSKLVLLQGNHTQGSATFTGIRTVVTRTVIARESSGGGAEALAAREAFWAAERAWEQLMSKDPLAQTFVLSESRHIAGIDFWLCKNGSSPVRIDIREVELGFPTKSVITTCVVPSTRLNENSFNRALFDIPAPLTAGVEYAVVLMTDTAEHEVGIAELGDWDPETGWIRAQRYTGGVLLSSSNNSTWTAHQGADLTFRLLGAVFESDAAKRVEIGEYDLTDVTDLLPMAELARTSAATDATFVLEKGGTEVLRVQAWQHLLLSAPLDGLYKVFLELFGNRHFSPIFGRDPQLVTGKVQTTGDYVSRAFKCGTGKRVMVTVDAITPGTSTIDVYVLTADGVWTKADLDEADPLGDNWSRQFYYVPCDRAETKIKIVLTGDAASRPRVKDIRGVILSA